MPCVLVDLYLPISSATPAVPVLELVDPLAQRNGRFGFRVSLSDDLLAVGIPRRTAINDLGATHVYDLATSGDPSTPIAVARLADDFGFAVAIAGGLVVVGAPLDDTGATDAGSAFVYDIHSADLWLDGTGEFQLGVGKTYLLGDANLDGFVDGRDFFLWNDHKFTPNTNWCDGNFNADLGIDAEDFVLWSANKFASSDLPSLRIAVTPVPSKGEKRVPSIASSGPIPATASHDARPVRWQRQQSTLFSAATKQGSDVHAMIARPGAAWAAIIVDDGPAIESRVRR